MKKMHLNKVILIVLLASLLAVMGGCGQKEYVAGTYASQYLTEISDLGGRVTGTDKEIAGGDFVKSTLEDMGYEVTVQEFDYDAEGTKGSSRNFIVEKKGATDDIVVLGAHYDSVDVGDGVDDNGSGVAVVLEVAKALKDTKTPQTLRFVFFGAEEAGLFGSDYYVSQLSKDEQSKIILMMNYDSLVAGDNAYVYGNGDAGGKFRDEALAIAKDKELELMTQPGENPEYPVGTTGDWSDHAAFKNVGIPYTYFESTNWTLGVKDGYTQVDVKYGVDGEIWHTKFDTAKYINTTFPDRIENRLMTFSTVTETFLQEDLSML